MIKLNISTQKNLKFKIKYKNVNTITSNVSNISVTKIIYIMEFS